MYKLIRFYNQNRKKIWTIILIIVFLLVLLQLLNMLARNNNSIDNLNLEINNNKNTNTSTKENKTVISDKSSVTGTSIPQSALNDVESLVDNFMEYCNEGKIQEAYELLTDDCKNELFRDLEAFRTEYYDILFSNGTKTYTIENWIGDTYKINMTNGDILSTGNITGSTVDYFTIDRQDNEYKLNIKNYVGKSKINKERNYEDLVIKVVSKDAYMDYEIYNIEVTNNSDKDVLLDTKETTTSLYLQDTKGAKYYAFTNELNDNELIVRKGNTKALRIKFGSSLSSNRKMDYMMFSNFISNYNYYEELENKEEYNFEQFAINI